MASPDFDLLIIGAGPAGCTLALNLAGKGIRIGILEKDRFPRHKICGDGLGGLAVNVLKRIPGGVYSDFIRDVDKVPSNGIRFIAPDYSHADVPFPEIRGSGGESPGFVCRRDDFDAFLFGKLRDHPDITILDGERISQVAVNSDRAEVRTAGHLFTARAVAGADGVHSVVRRSLQSTQNETDHICLGIRGYYENVTGLPPGGLIELIFLKRLLPGYFWIFPSSGGMVNAGFGMMKHRAARESGSMIQILEEIITRDPFIAPRFSSARLREKPGVHALPMGTRLIGRSGGRYLLLGDAGFLVDPFTGEGIGNAMASGETAAKVLMECFRNNDFSAGALGAYDHLIDRRFGQEFKTMAAIRHFARSPFLFNLVVRKARKNSDLRDLLTGMYNNTEARSRLTRPGFYATMIFR